MSPRLTLRIAAAVLLLFAVGHTVGFLAFQPSTAEGLAVLHAMNTVPLPEGGATYTYGDFYRGFGLFITVFQLFTAWLTWMLAQWSSENPKPVRTVAWGLCTVQVVSFALALKYFSPAPAVLSAITAILFAVAARANSKSI